MSVGSQPGEDSPGADLVLPCLTVVLADALVLPTDGANCSCTIFLAQILVIRLWPKTQPTMNVRREWVKELGFSEPVRSNAWIRWLPKINDARKISQVSLYSFFFFRSLYNFSVPFFGGLHYII